LWASNGGVRRSLYRQTNGAQLAHVGTAMSRNRQKRSDALANERRQRKGLKRRAARRRAAPVELPRVKLIEMLVVDYPTTEETANSKEEHNHGIIEKETQQAQ
jgi:hypothetical protein